MDELARTAPSYHYDPHSQMLSKIVRGFGKDLRDADRFVSSGMVDPAEFRALVGGIPQAAYARYPSLTRAAVAAAVEQFFAERDR